MVAFLGYATYYELPSKWERLAKANLVKSSAKLNFVLKNVYLEGHNYTNQHEIVDRFKLKKNTPILALDLAELQKELEQLPWVRYAIIDRQLPNTLMVKLIEKEPVAIWRTKKNFHLIDELGNEIAVKDLTRIKHLPIITGNNANKEFLEILPTISKDKELFDNILYANLVGGRRWNIMFLNNIKVKLPEQNVWQAWDYVIKLYYENKLSNMGISYLDLRLEDKLFLK